MKDIDRDLMQLLKSIYDDHDFVCGAMSNAGNAETRQKMYDYICYAKEHGYSVTSDDVLALSLILGNESNSQIVKVNAERCVTSVAL